MAVPVRADGCPVEAGELPAPATARIPKNAPMPAPATATTAMPTSGRDQRERWTSVLMAVTREKSLASSRRARLRRLGLHDDRAHRTTQNPRAPRARAAHCAATRACPPDARDRGAIL